MGWAMAINKEVFCSTFVLFPTFKLKPSLETHSAALEQVVGWLLTSLQWISSVAELQGSMSVARTVSSGFTDAVQTCRYLTSVHFIWTTEKYSKTWILRVVIFVFHGLKIMIWKVSFRLDCVDKSKYDLPCTRFTLNPLEMTVPDKVVNTIWI